MTEAERIRSVLVAELASAVRVVAASQAHLDQVVEIARQKRATWDVIGNAVGMTKQGARQRWGM